MWFDRLATNGILKLTAAPAGAVLGRGWNAATASAARRLACSAARSAARARRGLTATLSAAALAAVLPIQNRLGLDARVRLEAGHLYHRNLALDQALDVVQQFFLVYAHQRARLAVAACASGAADTVHVIFRHVGQLEVHHMR